MRRREDAHLAEKQSESSLAKEFAGKQAALSQLQNTLQQLPIATAQRVSQLDASISELEVRLKEAEGRRGYLLSAPISGRVSALQAWVGKLAEPKMPRPVDRAPTATFWRPSCSCRRGPSALSPPARPSRSATTPSHSSSFGFCARHGSHRLAYIIEAR